MKNKGFFFSLQQFVSLSSQFGCFFFDFFFLFHVATLLPLTEVHANTNYNTNCSSRRSSLTSPRLSVN